MIVCIFSSYTPQDRERRETERGSVIVSIRWRGWLQGPKQTKDAEIRTGFSDNDGVAVSSGQRLGPARPHRLAVEHFQSKPQRLRPGFHKRVKGIYWCKFSLDGSGPSFPCIQWDSRALAPMGLYVLWSHLSHFIKSGQVMAPIYLLNCCFLKNEWKEWLTNLKRFQTTTIALGFLKLIFLKHL